MHRYATHALTITLTLLTASTFACNKSEEETRSSPSSKGSAATLGPTPAITMPTAGTHAEHVPSWYAQVPIHAVMAKAGDKVWALVPFSLDSEATHATVVEVVSVEGNTATVRDLSPAITGYRHRLDPEARTMRGVPGLLVTPARTVDAVKPGKNDLVFAFQSNMPNPPLARIKAVADDLATYDAANATADKVAEEKTDIVEPYGHGIAPFTYAAVNTGGGTGLMLIMAVEGDAIYGKLLNGSFEKVTRSDCKSVTPSAKDRKAGDTVVAFPFGASMIEGTIDKVRVPGQIYEINGRPVTWDFVYDKI